MLVAADTDRGTVEKVAMTPPALALKEATPQRRSTAVISPALAFADTVPASEVSVTAPALVETDTATSRGTFTSYDTPHNSSGGEGEDTASGPPRSRWVAAGAVLEYEACWDTVTTDPEVPVTSTDPRPPL